MQFIVTILPYAQITISVLLAASILLQARGSSVGGAFGGGDESATFYTRRGSEKALFNATIVLGALFALSAFAQLFVA